MKIYNIDTETEKGEQEYLQHCKYDSPLFKHIEEKFDNWIEEPHRKEYREMYFSDEAIYEKAGAITGAIESIFDTMNEERLNYIYSNDPRLDFESQFEG